MKNSKHYSTEEDKVICETIKKSAGNITGAFKEIHKLLPNRNIAGLKARWYMHLKHSNKVFTLKSDTKELNNVKNVRSKENKYFNLTAEEKSFIRFARRNPKYVNLNEIKGNIIEKAIMDLRNKLEEE